MEDVDIKYDKLKLGLEDVKFMGELVDGVNRIRVCFFYFVVFFFFELY